MLRDEQPSDREQHPDLHVRPFRVLGLAREGIPIILIIAAGGLLISLASIWAFGSRPGSGVGVICITVTMWAIWFFRDPDRAPPHESGALLAPADGIVAFVKQASPPEELGIPADVAEGMMRISIFMNIFNVHVNRSPVDGRVMLLRYRPGRFINASLDKASKHNERCAMLMEAADERPVVVVQIAGLIARRIVCRAQEGQYLLAGERFGMIRFGSRVDVYVPEGSIPLVRVGQKTRAGVTIIARAARSSGPSEPSKAAVSSTAT